MTPTLVLTALALACQAPPQEKKDEKIESRTYYEYRNAADGITFKVDNGKVELIVPDEKTKGATKTYRAESLAEFRKLYPELVRKYDLDQYAPAAMKPEAVDQWWKEWATRFGADDEQRFRHFFDSFPKESTDAFRGLDRWFQEERQALRNLERRFHAEGMPLVPPSEEHRGGALGILVAPVTDALRSQLGLSEHEGLVVAEVEKNSLAERSELKPWDVLLKISGQPISDPVKFREQVLTGMHAKEFTLELIRGGHRMTVTIHPEQKS
jgi:hypothetical protein